MHEYQKRERGSRLAVKKNNGRKRNTQERMDRIQYIIIREKATLYIFMSLDWQASENTLDTLHYM